MFAFAGLFVALNAAGAAAVELSVCVERALADQGFDPGPVDGKVDAATRSAADSFTAENGRAMPPLALGMMREWSGTLANWDEHGSGPPLLLRSPVSFSGLGDLASIDTAALPRGIHFSSSIPIALRRYILEDLLWLAGLGELHQSDHLVAAMDLPAPLSGQKMVA